VSTGGGQIQGADPLNPARIFGLGSTPDRSTALVQSLDRGNSWTTLFAPGTAYSAQTPTRVKPAQMFVSAYTYATFSQTTYVSGDSGATWAPFTSTAPGMFRWLRQDTHRSNVIFGLRGPPTTYTPPYDVLRSDDGGLTWRVLLTFTRPNELGPELSIDPFRVDDLWLWNAIEGVLHSEDGGAHWEAAGGVSGFFSPDFSQNTIGQHFIDYGFARVILNPADSDVTYVIWKGKLYRGDRAARRDPVLVEFNYEDDRYWVSATQGEAVFQDSRMEPGHARRTGLRFGAWRADDAPAGALGSCRFWPKPETGLRTRVLVLQGPECEFLRANPGWILEAENEFYAVAPVNDVCPPGLAAVHRLPNMRPDLNFRWASDAAVISQMVARGWVDEGPKFCGRPLGSDE
jgi:hypothetical protein